MYKITEIAKLRIIGNKSKVIIQYKAHLLIDKPLYLNHHNIGYISVTTKSHVIENN